MITSSKAVLGLEKRNECIRNLCVAGSVEGRKTGAFAWARTIKGLRWKEKLLSSAPFVYCSILSAGTGPCISESYRVHITIRKGTALARHRSRGSSSVVLDVGGAGRNGLGSK